MAFNALRVDSAPSVLVDQILARIKAGDLPPGAALPAQRTLAKMLGVGLGTLREAIKVLTVMGHLEVIPGRGTFVTESLSPAGSSERLGVISTPDPSADVLQAVSLFDLLECREIVECGAARLAAQVFCPVGIEHLDRLNARLTTQPGDIDTYYRNDFEFHCRVAEATHNRAVIEMVAILVNRIHHRLDFMNNTLGLSLPLNVEACVRSAREVIACIKQGEAAQASKAMADHLAVVRLKLDRILFGKRREGQADNKASAEPLALP